MNNFTFDMAAEWMSLTQDLPAKTRITLFDAFTQYATTGEMPQLPAKDLFIFQLLLKLVVTNTTTTTKEKNIEKKNCSSSNEVKEVVAEEVVPAQSQSAPCTEADLAAYFTSCKLPNAKDQAHQCFAYNEARGWMQGGRRVTTRDGWHWIAQCWIRQASKHPAPPKAPLTDDEMAENRRKRAEEEAKANARMEMESHWNDVRNIVCLAHRDEYMDLFHPIRIVNETADSVLVSIPDDILPRLTTEPFRTTLISAVKQVYGNKLLKMCGGKNNQ